MYKLLAYSNILRPHFNSCATLSALHAHMLIMLLIFRTCHHFNMRKQPYANSTFYEYLLYGSLLYLC